MPHTKPTWKMLTYSPKSTAQATEAQPNRVRTNVPSSSPKKLFIAYSIFLFEYKLYFYDYGSSHRFNLC